MKLLWIKLMLFCITAFFVTSCGTTQPPTETIDTKYRPIEIDDKPQTKVQVHGGEIFLADHDGNRLWEAKAETIEGDFISGDGKMLGMECALLEDNSRLLQGKANEAFYRPDSQEIVLRGEVQADWPQKNAKMHAQEMIWSLKQRTIEAKGDVFFSRRDEYLHGEVLRADFSLQSIELLNGEDDL